MEEIEDILKQYQNDFYEEVGKKAFKTEEEIKADIRLKESISDGYITLCNDKHY